MDGKVLGESVIDEGEVEKAFTAFQMKGTKAIITASFLKFYLLTITPLYPRTMY